MVTTQTAETDPFGLEIKPLSSGGTNSQNYRFQNQEKVSDFGLNLNWFKYRPFDAETGRGWQIDRLADQYVHNSPYAFSENKVIRHIELDGLEAVDFVYGIGAALRDDFGTPDGRSTIQDRPGFIGAFNNGRNVGHSFAAIGGLVETLGGVIGVLGSGAGELFSGGAASPIALPALAASAAATGHGANSTANAVSNLLNDKGRVQANGTKTTHETYTKENSTTGEVYSGRTSGKGTPEQNIAKRDNNHHKTQEGFGPARLDKSSPNSDAIRGREQQLIDYHGGAKSKGGTSGNDINGISDKNPKRQQYINAANKEFK